MVRFRFRALVLKVLMVGALFWGVADYTFQSAQAGARLDEFGLANWQASFERRRDNAKAEREVAATLPRELREMLPAAPHGWRRNGLPGSETAAAIPHPDPWGPLRPMADRLTGAAKPLAGWSYSQGSARIDVELAFEGRVHVLPSLWGYLSAARLAETLGIAEGQLFAAERGAILYERARIAEDAPRVIEADLGLVYRTGLTITAEGASDAQIRDIVKRIDLPRLSARMNNAEPQPTMAMVTARQHEVLQARQRIAGIVRPKAIALADKLRDEMPGGSFVSNAVDKAQCKTTTDHNRGAGQC